MNVSNCQFFSVMQEFLFSTNFLHVFRHIQNVYKTFPRFTKKLATLCRKFVFQTWKPFLYFASDPLKKLMKDTITHYQANKPLKIVLRACINRFYGVSPWPIYMYYICLCCNFFFIFCIVNYCLHLMKSVKSRNLNYFNSYDTKVNTYDFFNSSSETTHALIRLEKGT